MGIDIDVTIQRSEDHIKFKNMIDLAFTQRQIQHKKGNTNNTDEQIESAKNRKKIFEKLSDEVIYDFGELEQMPGEIFVENSHDYPTLIRMALDKLVSEGVFVEDKPWAEAITKDRSLHEWEHAVAGLGLDEFKLYFGIRFYEIEKDSEIGITPIIQPTGKAPVGVYREIINGPKDLSDSDKSEL